MNRRLLLAGCTLSATIAGCLSLSDETDEKEDTDEAATDEAGEAAIDEKEDTDEAATDEAEEAETDEKEDTDEPETDEEENTIEVCDTSGRWQGEGEPITTKAELDQEEDTEDGWEEHAIRRESLDAAVEAALLELDDRLGADIELRGQAGTGISYSHSGIDGWDTDAWVHTGILNCPELEVATARANLPAEVTVTLELTNPDELRELTHEIQLRVGEEAL